MLYFAYGSNLCTRQMSERCGSWRLLTRAALPGFRLSFPRRSEERDGGGVAGVTADAGAAVQGVVYELSEEDLAKIDDFEGVPEDYTRERVRVRAPESGELEVWTYFAVPQAEGPFAPSRAYLDSIIEGAREHGLPAPYVAALEAHPVC